MTDRNGSTHTYSYDVLGRMTADDVTTLGSGVDGAVRELTYSFNPAGLPYQQTSLNSTGGVVNQIEDYYNGRGQLITQWQATTGSVNTSSTPSVQYTYATPALGSRPSEMIYPNGRILHYVYNSGLDATIGRVSALADDNGSGSAGTDLEEYAYLGLSTIVSENRPEPGVELTYLQQSGDTLTSTAGGDQYTGLDQFGRVIDQNWIYTSDGTRADRFQYGYDADGNVLYKRNRTKASLSELYHLDSTSTGDNATAYDPLNRLVNFERGTLAASGHNGSGLDKVSTPSSLDGQEVNWTMNSLGNFTSTVVDGSTGTSTFNSQNSLTSVTTTGGCNGDIHQIDNSRLRTQSRYNSQLSADGQKTCLRPR
jgi:hypothetical protein